jgi:hypothetical protein
VGQSFGIVSAVASVVGLALLAVTLVAQMRELRAQRSEIAVQRETLDEVRKELNRSVEAELRALHSDLLKLAINDPELAEVWPPFAGTTPEQNRQYLYINLVLQHAWLQMRLEVCTEAEMRSNLRYLLASPAIRAYWRATAPSRSSIYVAGTTEYALAEIADEICREYEAVLACADTARKCGSPRRHDDNVVADA